MAVLKMRGSRHASDEHRMTIVLGGLQVEPLGNRSAKGHADEAYGRGRTLEHHPHTGCSRLRALARRPRLFVDAKASHLQRVIGRTRIAVPVGHVAIREPIPPGKKGRVVVEVEATENAARGTFTLKLWSQDGSARGEALDGVRFP